MARNTKGTSGSIASLAGRTLVDSDASNIAKQLAASALSQVNRGHQTGSELEDVASRVLASDKYSEVTKALAGSVLSQSNKAR